MNKQEDAEVFQSNQISIISWYCDNAFSANVNCPECLYEFNTSSKRLRSMAIKTVRANLKKHWSRNHILDKERQ